MKLLPVLAVFLYADLVAVQADFHLNLFYPETKKYLSNILLFAAGFEDDHFIEATKDKPDQFCRFNFVTSGLPEGKVSFQTNNDNYFNLAANNYIQSIVKSINTTSEFDFIFESDPRRKRGARIALKASNGMYWTVAERYVKAESTTPVYFDIYPVEWLMQALWTNLNL